MLWLTGFCLGLSRLDLSMAQQSIQVKGEIISLVSQNSDWLSLDISTIKPNLIFGPQAKLRLTWKAPPDVEVGQVWLFTLKPKSISSVLNQGGYNEQKQLISQHIVGKGSIIKAELIESHPSLRNRLITQLSPQLSTLPRGDILLALILGDKQLISQTRWQTLRQTGTGHLVAISGLHLSVVTAWIYACVLFALNRYAPSPSRRNLAFSLIISAGGAIFYAYLAGFAVSTQRALVMILLLIFLSLLKRFSSPWDRLLFALFIVLLIDPLSCLSAGFWLSFCALTIILYTLEAAPKPPALVEHTNFTMSFLGRVKQFWSIQWRLSLGLGLVQAILFGGVTAHSLWINLLMVPWFSFVVIPLAMAGFVLWWLSSLLGLPWMGLFQLSDWALIPYGKLLEISGHLPAHWQVVSDSVLAMGFFALLGGMLWRYIPRQRQYWPWYGIVGCFFVPLILLFFWKWSSFKSSTWIVHLLDVRQGLAVVVEKDGRGLIYDTGAAFGDGFSYSERVIVPFLHAKSIQDIDYIIISHNDNDHAGGADVLAKAYPLAKWIGDVPHLAGETCHPRQIEWQSLKLSIVSNTTMTGNNGSCVLRIDDGQQSVLLTGDIEKEAEAVLVAQVKMQSISLACQVLIAPHHGSNTSSTEAFIDVVIPELVIFPAGLNNRYRFPKPAVVERYQRRDISYLITGHEGQISVIFQQNGRVVKTYRRDLAPFWYNRLFRFGDLINPE